MKRIVVYTAVVTALLGLVSLTALAARHARKATQTQVAKAPAKDAATGAVSTHKDSGTATKAVSGTKTKSGVEAAKQVKARHARAKKTSKRLSTPVDTTAHQ
jgi:hypothetical protein